MYLVAKSGGTKEIAMIPHVASHIASTFSYANAKRP